MKNDNSLFKFSKDRPIYINIIYMIVCFVGLIFIPSIIALFLNRFFIKSEVISSLIAELSFILILYLMYFKDLNYEFKLFFKDFKNKFKHSFKIYIIGFMGMVFFNLLITIFLKNISSNEEQVRQLLYNNTIFALFNISIIAPLSEEIIFRKSLQPLINNKWIYVITCGLLFGFAHILTNIMSGEFSYIDLVYILPYACLGSSFALMDYDTKTTFSSIFMHFMHNTFTAILLLIVYFGGK